VKRCQKEVLAINHQAEGDTPARTTRIGYKQEFLKNDRNEEYTRIDFPWYTTTN
jgi:hypothetical protein